ncbi:MAG: TAXI family TRAP transporter solute-binding subunit [Hyphomicrobiales bacterium]|nr:TAXI family TRAP transporter solute-binding subunit [Hyphomicrobiales bacterium]
MRFLFKFFVFGLFMGIVLYTESIAQAQDATLFTKYQDEKRQANTNTVTIIGSSLASAYARFAEDLQNVLDDPKTNDVRVLPILGRGGGQNVLDILFLKGIDMGFVDQDNLAYFKKKEPALFANIEQRIHYIAKIGHQEFHVLTKSGVNSIEELRGKKVNFLKVLSASHLASENFFSILGINVEPTFYDHDLAVEKIKSGEITAAFRTVAAPVPAFSNIKDTDGLKLLPLDSSTLPAGGYEKLLAIYLPAVLRNEDYPGVIAKGEPLPTLANSTVLAVYTWPENTDRYQRMAKFVTKFFANIEKFRTGPRHPKWKEVNLAAEVPGWNRFKPAQQWLDANRGAETASSNELKVAFDSFLKEYSKASGSNDLTKVQKEALFGQFVKWWQTQKPQQAAR